LPCPGAGDEEEVGRNYGRLVTSPEFAALRAIKAAESDQIGNGIDVPALREVLTARIDAVNQGDMRATEGMLMAQAAALQTLFSRLIERASCQSSIQVGEALYRMAFRAQNQSRATLETLSKVKNPPVYAKQANIGTNVQVNNGSRAHGTENQPTQLLTQAHGTTLDTLGTGTTGGIDQAMETVGAVDGTTHGGG